MELRTAINNGVCELAIAGELTIYHAKSFRQELDKAIRRAAAISLDLAQVSEIDTAGFQLLMQVHKACREYGKQLTFSAVSPAVMEVMGLFGLAGYFDGNDSMAHS